MQGRTLFKVVKPLALIISLIFKIIPSFILFFIWDLLSIFDNKAAVFFRYCIIKSKSKTCGDNVYIGKNVTLKKIGSLELESNISIHNNCYIDASGGILIKDDVSIAHSSTIMSSSHTWADKSIPIKYNPQNYSKVIINSNVWIGCGVRILDGVEIKENVIIGAGAVCTKPISAEGIYAGMPAKKIKDI